MLDWTPQGAACRILGFIPILALVLSGCAATEPDRATKHRRDIRTLTSADDTLDGLPLLRLNTDPRINLDEYTPSDISFAGRHYEGTEAKYRGATSSAFPKKSFTLEFAKRDVLDDERSGFTNARKVVLTSSFDDASYVRQALAFEIWSRMDPEHLHVRTAFVSVVLNEEYEGIYLMVDHVDDELMERLGFWEDGNLYKGRNKSADFALKTAAGEEKSPHSGFTKEEGDPEDGEEGAFADLDAFVEWLAQADGEELKNDLGAYVDVRDYVDWWVLVALIDATDTLNKNTHHYRDPRPANPPNVFRFMPWDFNASFGQDWRTRPLPATDPLERFDGANEVFARLTGSDYFAAELRTRFRTLLPEALSLTWVQSWLGEARARIEPAALQDEACWSELYRESFEVHRGAFTDYATETAYVDEWIAARWDFASDQLGPPDEPSQGEHQGGP